MKYILLLVMVSTIFGCCQPSRPTDEIKIKVTASKLKYLYFKIKLTEEQSKFILNEMPKAKQGITKQLGIKFKNGYLFVNLKDKTLFNKIESDVKNGFIVVDDIPKGALFDPETGSLTFDETSISSSGSSNSLSFGPGGVGTDMGNGFQRNISDGTFGPRY